MLAHVCGSESRRLQQRNIKGKKTETSYVCVRRVLQTRNDTQACGPRRCINQTHRGVRGE